MDLNDQLKQVLGVVPPPPPPTPVLDFDIEPFVEERPAPKYQYKVTFVMKTYGTVFVEAEDETEAEEDAWHYDIDWEDVDYSDADHVETELDDDEIVNQDEIDEWDEEFGARYAHDGTPKCTRCGAPHAAHELTLNADRDAWYCAPCLAKHPELITT